MFFVLNCCLSQRPGVVWNNPGHTLMVEEWYCLGLVLGFICLVTVLTPLPRPEM